MKWLRGARDMVAGMLPGIVLWVVVVVAFTLWQGTESVYLRECSQMRTLADCKADAVELYR